MSLERMNKNNSFRSSNFQLFFVNLSHILNVFIIHLKITPMLSTLKNILDIIPFDLCKKTLYAIYLATKTVWC